jgi:hypothetical protein
MPELRDFVKVTRKLHTKPGTRHMNSALAGNVANQLRRQGIKIETREVGERRG